MQIIRQWHLVFFLITILLVNSADAAMVKPLPAEQAFKLSVIIPRSNEIQLSWVIAPGYYLYAKKMQINFPATVQADIRLPQGEFEYDKNYGKYEAYAGDVSVPVFLNTKAQQVDLTISYQGCSKDGFCYPPIYKNFNLDLTNRNVQSGKGSKLNAQSLLTNQEGIKSLLATKNLGVILLLFAGLGLLLAFTPCVLPMIPILTSIIVGHHVLNTKKAFLLSLSYVFGMACTYAIIGIVAAFMGNSLQVWLQQPWIIVATSALFLLLSLSLFGLYDLRLPYRLQTKMTTWSNRQKSGTFPGVFLMGAISTLIVSPCVTAPLVGVLMYIAETGNLVYGASTLFTLGLGMGLPLLLIGGSVGKWLPKAGPWMEVIKHCFGLLMLAMAIWLVSRVVSQEFVMMFWGILLIIIAFYFAIFLPQLIGQTKLNRGLGIGVGTCGLIIILGSINPTAMNILDKREQIAVAKHAFIVVRNVADLSKQLARAEAEHQPVILDFYADWCSSCVEMDKKVFALSDVQQKIKKYTLLRADLSANSNADEALLKYFNIIAPPTILFFDNKGQEINSQRIVGEVSAKEFLNRLGDSEVINAS